MANKNLAQAQTSSGNQFNTDDLMSVLQSLKGNVMRSLHVATLGVATKTTDDDVLQVTVTTFPKAANQPDGYVSAICFTSIIYSDIKSKLEDHPSGCFVMLIASDKKSDSNFSAIKSSKKVTICESNDTLHSVNNYIIVSVGNCIDGSAEPSPTGVIGPVGPTGPTGATGDAGSTGPVGPTGASGEGTLGPTGPQGIQGIQGVQGAQGNEGPTGAIGSQGIQGIQGSIGPTGPQGIQGEQEAQGNEGTAGAQGHTGATGSAGADGASGSDSGGIDLTPDSVTVWSSGDGGSTFRVCDTDLGRDLSGTVSDLLRVAQSTGNLYVKGTLTAACTVDDSSAIGYVYYSTTAAPTVILKTSWTSFLAKLSAALFTYNNGVLQINY